MRKVVFMLFFFLVLAVPLVRAEAPAVSSADVFPLHPGSFWLYQGMTQWTQAGSAGVQEKVLVWKMEIVDVVVRGSWKAARLKGHPLDLAWYEEGRERGDYLVLFDGAQKYYLLEGSRVGDAIARLNDARDDLAGLVNSDDLFLTTPLTVQPAATVKLPSSSEGTRYSWVVENEARADVSGLGERFSRQPLKQYQIVFRTAPDNTTIDFVPGVGITHFIYQHHGTVAEADVKLIEYYPGKS